jgi:Fe-S-cluster containining protein
MVVSDRELIQIVDAAMAEAVRTSGDWIYCHLGCTECCIGPFPITALDARRLQDGLAELAIHDRERACRVTIRARQSAERIVREFPDHSIPEVLDIDEAFENEPCPALDPESGACDLYAFRPITCRTFGPSVRLGDGAVGVCHLCYQGASDEEIAACQVEVSFEEIEDQLLGDKEAPVTIVAFALAVEEHR